MTDEQALKAAFLAVYNDLAAHGFVRKSEEIAEELFEQFKQDLESGFASIFQQFN